MELIEEMTIKTKGSSENVELFQKVNGAIFCDKCGKQYSELDIQKNGSECSICKNDSFIKGEFAATLAGYIRLNKMGRLKEYYKKRFKRTGKTMNVRRLVLWLLIDDGFVISGNKKTEDIVYRTLWKGW